MTFQQRISESTDAHNKLQSHLSKTMQEIYDQVKDTRHYLNCILEYSMMKLTYKLGHKSKTSIAILFIHLKDIIMIGEAY